MAQSFAHRYGPWAIVTGASSGIGEALARQLAARGLSLILVARRRSRLETLSRELIQEHKVDALIVELDLGEDGAITRLSEAVGDCDVGLVCANAGVGEKGAFETLEWASYQRMIRLNCESTAALVHAFIPRLTARRHGGLMITSSTAALQGTPWASAYAATKAFDLVFAEGLYEELGPRGVDVVALCPGSTDTEGPRRTGVDPAKVPFGMATAESVARAGIDALGRRCVVLPRRIDRIAALLIRLVPRGVAASIAGRAIRRVAGVPELPSAGSAPKA